MTRRAWKWCLLTLALMSMLLAAGCGSSPEDVYKQAQSHLSKGEYTQAAEKFESLGGYEDATTLTMYCRACALAESGDYQMGMAALESLGDFKDCRMRIAYYRAREMDDRAGTTDWALMLEAEEAYLKYPLFLDTTQRIAALRTRHEAAIRAALDRGIAAGERGDYSEAFEIFDSLDMYQEARERFDYFICRRDEDALGQTPQGQDRIYKVAMAYKALGNLYDCAERARKLIEQADEVVAARYTVVRNLLAEGQNAQAQGVLDAFGSYGSEDVKSWYYAVAEGYLAAEDWKASSDAFVKAVGYSDAADRAGEPYLKQAEALMAGEQWNDAASAFQNAFRAEQRAIKSTTVTLIADKYENNRQYCLIRASEAKLTELTPPAELVKLSQRYAALGEVYDAQERAAGLQEQADAIVSGKYAQAAALTEEGRFAEAMELLKNFGDYGQTQVPATYYMVAEQALAAGSWLDAVTAFQRAGSYSDAKSRINESYYCQAEALLAEGEWDAASAAFKNAGYYSDAKSRIKEPYYRQGRALMAEENWEEALAALGKAGSFGDVSKCRMYCTMRSNEAALPENADVDTIAELAAIYEGMGGFSDSAERAAALRSRADAMVAERYAQVDALVAQEQFAEAIEVLKNFCIYGSERVAEKYYAIGLACSDEADWKQAALAFRLAGSYEDAEARIPYIAARENEQALADAADVDQLVALAASYTEIAGVLDSAERAAALTLRADGIVAERWAEFDRLTSEGLYADALKVLNQFGEYGGEECPDRYRALAESSMAVNEWQTAAAAFEKAPEAEDREALRDYCALREEEAAYRASLDVDALIGLTDKYQAMKAVQDSEERAEALRKLADEIVAARYAEFDRLLAEGLKEDARRILENFSKYGYEQVPEKYRQIDDYVAALEAARKLYRLTGDLKALRDMTAVHRGQLSTVFDYYAMVRADGTVIALGFGRTLSLEVEGWKNIISVAADSGCILGVKVDGTTVIAGGDKMIANAAQWRDIVYITTGTAFVAGLRQNGTVAYTSYFENNDLAGWTGIVDLASRDHVLLGLKNDGTVLQKGRVTKKKEQTDPSEWTDIVDVAVGENFVAGLKADGTVVVCGSHQDLKWTEIIAIDATNEAVVGLKADGTLVCEARWLKENVSGLTDVIAFECGYSDVLALKQDGSVTKANTTWQKPMEDVDLTAGKYAEPHIRVMEILLEPYRRAERLQAEGKWAEAADAFQQAAEYADAPERVKENRYHQAMELAQTGKWAEAAEAFAAAGDYSDAPERLLEAYYRMGLELQEQGDNTGAYNPYRKAYGYPAANERLLAIQAQFNQLVSTYLENTVAVGLDGTVYEAGESIIRSGGFDKWQGVVAVSNAYDHAVGLKADGTVVAAGSNENDRCNVNGWSNVVSVAAGAHHTVALLENGTVVATGKNNHDECNVGNWSKVKAIAAGFYFTLGLREDGTVVTTGTNYHGQCETNSWTDIVAIAAGTDHSVGLKSDGTVVAVGYDYDDRCDVSDWKDIIAIAAGRAHTVGLRADGTVVAVGDGDEGACSVSKWTDIVAVYAGFDHTIGLKADGTLVYTGELSDAQKQIANWDLWD